MLKKLTSKLTDFVNDEKGELSQMTWVIGSAVVVALVIVAAMTFAPDTAGDFWDAATQWIRDQLGF